MHTSNDNPHANKSQNKASLPDMVTATKQIEGLSYQIYTCILLFVGFIITGIGFYLRVSSRARDNTVPSGKLAALLAFGDVLISIGASVLSAIIIFLLYSRRVERHLLASITANTAEAAIAYANTLFQERFNHMLPSKTYDATPTPDPKFREDFDMALKKSSIYRFQGDTGDFTTFRLHQLCEAGQLLNKEIILMVIDPREHSLLRERAIAWLNEHDPRFNKQDLEKRFLEISMTIYATIVALYDIAHRVNVELVFHKEHQLSRTEMFDDVLFLTYYLDGEFPATYNYPSITIPYKAHSKHFRQVYASAKTKIIFNDRMTDQELHKYLMDLECKFEIEKLRDFYKTEFKRYDAMENSK